MDNGLKEMEKLKEGELLFLKCAPLLTITASFLNGNESGNHSGTNKSGLGSSWGKRLVLLILCRAGLGPLSYQPLTCPRLPVFTLFCLGPDFFDLAWIFCSGWRQSEKLRGPFLEFGFFRQAVFSYAFGSSGCTLLF